MTAGADGPLRVLFLESPAELQTVNRKLGEDPRRLLTVALLPSGAPIPAESASNVDLVLAEGGTEDESANNLPLVAVPNLVRELRALEAAVEARPNTAAVLARLLRTTADLPLEAALEVESLAYGTLLGGAEFADWLGRRRPAARPAAPGPDPVLVHRAGNSLTITLNTPERHNAYSARMRDALLDALCVPLLDDSITSVELRGAGKSLCSGADLGEFGLSRDLPAAHLLRTQQHVGRALAALGGKVHVRAHGACIGAGIEIPAFAARITAAPGAFFRLPELAMGLIPGAGGTVSIPRRIGRWRTLYMVLSGVDIRAGRAVRWGLADALEQ